MNKEAFMFSQNALKCSRNFRNQMFSSKKLQKGDTLGFF